MLEIIIGQLIWGLIIFVIVYLFYHAAVLRKPKKLEKFLKGTEATMLKMMGKLDFEKHDPKKLARTIALTNSLVMGAMFAVLTLIKNIYVIILAGALLMVVVTFIVYKILGANLKKKEVKKNV